MRNLSTNDLCLSLSRFLVSTSARLDLVLFFVIQITPATQAFLTQWYQIATWLFLRGNSEIVVLLMTNWLLPNTLVGPSKGTPNVCSLYLGSSIIFMAILRVINSEPNIEVSTVFWRLEYHMMGALFTEIIIPVCDLLETTYPAWLASKNNWFALNDHAVLACWVGFPL